MQPDTSSPIYDLAQALERAFSGAGEAGTRLVRTDLTTRMLYSTDASIYQVEPLGVAFPRTLDDLAAAVEISAGYGVPLLARGAGSSLAGQAIGPALVLDCSRYLNHIVEIDPEQRTAIVEPGLILNALNRQAKRYGLQFGPDPASSERATMGGSLANNASGAHSILYGLCADHLLSADVVLSDGSIAVMESIPVEEARRRAGGRGEGERRSIEAGIYRAALDIREQYADAIRTRWPKTWRRASGYSLNYLLPWSPSQPPQWGTASESPYPPVAPGCMSLTPLLAGSEGTLAVIRKATVGLVPLPRHTALGVLAFDSIAGACDAVPGLLERGPTAVELIPQMLIRLARSMPAYARQLGFVEQLGSGGDPAALLVVEFSGDDPAHLREQVRGLRPDVLLAESAAEQARVWGVRKMGLGILQSRPGDRKPVAFIEDLAVPVERLGDFVREIDRILAENGTTGDMYAHASAGCLHIRPIVNLKTIQGKTYLRRIAEDAIALTLKLGGSVSGEHGDGLARSEWLEPMYGIEILTAFQELKAAADPRNLLNPGKIASPQGLPAPRMDADLRYGPEYRAEGWQTVLGFSGQAGLTGAIEQCNGAGVCRKAEGVMCPSFQATEEEMHSTRGRANLLRMMITGRFPTQELAERTVYEALDLCLACKGCKAECPSGVDMAKLRYEFDHFYYTHHRRRLRDYLFGYIELLARLGQPFSVLANPILGSASFSWLAGRFLGLSTLRKLPRLNRRSFQAQAKPHLHAPTGQDGENVLLLSDTFTEFFYPEAGLAALRALQAAGCHVRILPVLGAGRTLISKGFLEAAKQQASRLVESVRRLDPGGEIPVVGIEPSEILTLRDEYLDLLPGEAGVKELAGRAWMIDEFLVRPGKSGEARMVRIANNSRGNDEKGEKRKEVLLHGHCYQKAQPPAADGYPVGVGASVAMLQAAGYKVKVIESGCCGMAGAFGYESEHYQISMQVGELALLPAARQAGGETLLAAAGVSCQAQIEDGTGRPVAHPIQLI